MLIEKQTKMEEQLKMLQHGQEQLLKAAGTNVKQESEVRMDSTSSKSNRFY